MQDWSQRGAVCAQPLSERFVVTDCERAKSLASDWTKDAGLCNVASGAAAGPISMTPLRSSGRKRLSVVEAFSVTTQAPSPTATIAASKERAGGPKTLKKAGKNTERSTEMIGEHSTVMGDAEMDPSQLLVDRSRRGETASSFNKSMDFARHTGKGKPSASVPTHYHAPSDAMLFGESYATMGESFLGESFANMGDASFALTAGGFMDGGEYSYSDSNDGDEAWVKPMTKTDLATVIDIEEDEEEESNSEGRSDDTGATSKA